MARLIPPMWLLEEFDIDPHDPDNERKLWKALALKYHPALQKKRGRGRPPKTEFDRLNKMTMGQIDLLHRIDELKQHYEENPSKFKDIYPKSALERAFTKVAKESGWTRDKLEKLYYPRRPRKSRRKNTE